MYSASAFIWVSESLAAIAVMIRPLTSLPSLSAPRSPAAEGLQLRIGVVAVLAREARVALGDAGAVRVRDTRSRRGCLSPRRRRDTAPVRASPARDPWRRGPSASAARSTRRARPCPRRSASPTCRASPDSRGCRLLKCANCAVIYSAGNPARLGLAGDGLLPSVPWQAAQIWLTMVCALARSGLRRLGGRALRQERGRGPEGKDGGDQQRAFHRADSSRGTATFRFAWGAPRSTASPPCKIALL